MESFLQGEELERVHAECMAAHGGRNLHLRSPAVLDLLDHEDILGYLVDAAGWNVQCRDCLLGKQEPRESHPDKLQRA
jgi:hypothetical protein